MTPPIPQGPQDLTWAWLSAVLGRDTGPVMGQRIGEDAGFTGGGLYRLTAAEGSWVAKLSPSDPAMRALWAQANAREVQFYTEFSAGLPVPGCDYGAFDAETGASVVLLQDLAGFRAGDFRTGLSAEEAGAVADAMAAIHAAWWEAPEVRGLSGAAMLDEFGFVECWAAYPKVVARLLPEVTLPPGFLALGDHIAAHSEALFEELLEEGPITVLHRDCQADNMMFDADGRAVVLDWQLMGKGRGVYDIAYVLIGSVKPALRREIEADVVRRYHDRLCTNCVSGYAFDDCWADYRRAVIGKVFLTTVATVLLDNDTPHRRAWRRADLERLLAFCADHGFGPGDLPV